MNIRPLTEPDLPEFLALLQAKASFDGNLETLQATEATLREALFGAKPLAFALVAESTNGRLVGMGNEVGQRFYRRLGAKISEGARVARLDAAAIAALVEA